MAKLVQVMRVESGDAVGKLAEVTEALRQADINIMAVCAWTEGQTGKMLLMTSDNSQACPTLSGIIDDCGWQEMIAVNLRNEVGSLCGVAEKIAKAGVSIKRAFGSAADGDALLLIETTDNKKALAAM